MSVQLPKKTEKSAVPVRDIFRSFNENERFAVLASQGADTPYTSLVAYAVTPDLKKVIFFTTRKTRKYKNILSSRHVALLIDNRSSARKPLMGTEAITILGLARPLRKGNCRDEYAAIFLKKHPDFEGFIKDPATVLISVEIKSCIHVSRFQVVSVWEPFSDGR